MFGFVAEKEQDRGKYYLFYQYNEISGAAVLAALVAGESGIRHESLDAAEAVEGVMKVLRMKFERKGVTLPSPLKVGLRDRCQAWLLSELNVWAQRSTLCCAFARRLLCLQCMPTRFAAMHIGILVEFLRPTLWQGRFDWQHGAAGAGEATSATCW
jgi:hypothetical protein